MIFRNFKIALMREVRVWVYKDGTWSHCCCHYRQLHDTFLMLLMIPCDKFGLLPCKRALWCRRAVSVATTDVLTFFLSFRTQPKRCKHCGGKLTKQASKWNTVLCLCSAQCTVCCRLWPKLWRRSTAAGCSVTFRPLQSKPSMSFTQKATVDTPGGCVDVSVSYLVILCLVMDSCLAEGRSSWVAWISLFALDRHQKEPSVFPHTAIK